MKETLERNMLVPERRIGRSSK